MPKPKAPERVIAEALDRTTAALLTAAIVLAYGRDRPSELTNNPYRWTLKTYEKMRDVVDE
jgi:hypothetical protein